MCSFGRKRTLAFLAAFVAAFVVGVSVALFVALVDENEA
jgi:flagellar biosynthesis protein FliQ